MMASRNLLPDAKDTLSDTCRFLDIENEGAHTALGDAQAAMRIFHHLSDDGQRVEPASVNYATEALPSRTLERTAFSGKPDDALGRIYAFTRKVPFPTSDEKFIAYLLLLNMAMADLSISEDEAAELSKWATELGISEEEIDSLHIGYLESFIQAALRDGIVTTQEREMIERVGKALKLPVNIPDAPQRIQINPYSLEVGRRVCFTGEASGFTGQSIDREDLEALASKVGLHPVRDVTKKGCDLLVAADESTSSGKAKRAKEWGIPIMSVDRFITFCTFGK
jgi:DNA polymerase-3 subunit epsilon